MKPEIIGPDKDVMALLKAIVEQHAEIVKANAEIMRSFSRPIIYQEQPQIDMEALKSMGRL